MIDHSSRRGEQRLQREEERSFSWQTIWRRSVCREDNRVSRADRRVRRAGKPVRRDNNSRRKRAGKDRMRKMRIKTASGALRS